MDKCLFSGIQPSGTLHLGNYLGAIKNWVALQENYEPIFCVVDLHAITVPQKPEELRKKTIEVAKIYLAAGIDPQRSIIFVQSHVPEHTELAWILNTITKIPELERMTQFKDKTTIRDIKEELALVDKFADGYTEEDEKIRKIMREINPLRLKKTLEDFKKIEDSRYHNFEKVFKYLKNILNNIQNKEKVSAGLFNYPVLMAADILLYDTNVVPVGEDQLQHVEIARTLARRFNAKFGETFVIPEPSVVKEGMRIMGLDDPLKKMSKSAASEYNYIALTDDAEKIREKIKKAVTDSGKNIRYSDEKPAIKNLINIYALLDNAKPTEIAAAYRGKKYAEFKNDLADIIVDFLKDFQEKFNNIDDREVLNILETGAAKAQVLAGKKMEEVKEKVGLLS